MQGEARLLVVCFKLASIVVLLKNLIFLNSTFSTYIISLWGGGWGGARGCADTYDKYTLDTKNRDRSLPDFGLLVLLGDFLQPRSIPPAKPEVLVFIPLAL